MAKVVFGEFAAFDTQGGIRFMKNGKLASENGIPPEVVVFLKKKLEQPKAPLTPDPEAYEAAKAIVPTRPVLTEEQKAQLRAESLAVKPELQASPEKLAEDAASLTIEDFGTDEPEITGVEEADTAPSPEQMADVSKALAPDSSGQAPLPRTDEPVRPVDKNAKSIEVLNQLQPEPLIEPNFLETVSIHTADLKDIVRSLYERFGIYTVYLGQLPNPDEINPLTGEMFTKYHQGIAYQAALGAQNRGVLDRKPEEGRRLMDEGRNASQNFAVDPVPQTIGEARRTNSFDYRTSVTGNEAVSATEIVHITDENGVVHAVQRPIQAGEGVSANGAPSRFDEKEDELIVEPRMGKQVIRPNW